MANEQNLRPSEYKLSQEEAKKGGINSGKARREKKAMREAFKEFLKLPIKDGELTENINAIPDLKGANITVQEAIAFAQIRKALDGDTTAAAFVRDTSGEKPADKVEVNSDIEKSTEELRGLLAKKKNESD